MIITSSFKSSFCNALIVYGFIASISIATADTTSDDASMPQAHSNSIGEAVTDASITAKVKIKLMDKDSLEKSDISVSTTNGVVTLDGSVGNLKAKSMAESLTRSVDGVKSVDNNLTAPGSSHAAAQTKRVLADSWITTKVKSVILADNVSKGFDVSVETIHGVVILKGNLPNQDAIDHVKDITEKVDSVKSVDTSDLKVAKN